MGRYADAGQYRCASGLGAATPGGGVRKAGYRHRPPRSANRTFVLLSDAFAFGRLRVELFRRQAENVYESRRHVPLRSLSVRRTVQGQCEQLYFRIAERSDFRPSDDTAQRPAAEDRRSPGGVCITHYGEAGEQGGYASTDRFPDGVGQVSLFTEIRRLGRGSRPANGAKVQSRSGYRRRLQHGARCAGRSSGSTPASQIRIYLQDRNHPVLFTAKYRLVITVIMNQKLSS